MSSVSSFNLSSALSEYSHHSEDKNHRNLERLIYLHILEWVYKDIGLGHQAGLDASGSKDSSQASTDKAGSDEMVIKQSAPFHMVEGTPDDRIDRLLDAITQVREIWFTPDQEAGTFNVYATAPVIAADEDDEVEKQKAAAPEVFGGLLIDQVGPATAGTHSPGTVVRHERPAVLNRLDTQEPQDWESLVALADARYDRLHNVPNRAWTKSSKGTPSPFGPFPAHQDSGRHVVVAGGQGRAKCYSVSPVPFNFAKTRNGLRTPSIRSSGTEQDCSSPLFGMSCQFAVKQVLQEACSPSVIEMVDRWLGNDFRPAPPRPDEVVEEEGEEDDLEVWQDVSSSGPSSSKKSNAGFEPSTVFKDVTNIRQAGYLQHNSFFQDTKGKGKAPYEKQEDAFSNASTAPPSDHEFLNWSRISTPKSFDDRDAAVDADVAYTLAILEGHVITDESPSPVTRFVRPQEHYNDDVTLDWYGPELCHPRPLRPIHMASIVAKMEQFGEDTDSAEGEPYDTGFEGEAQGFARPANPTPRRAMVQYMSVRD